MYKTASVDWSKITLSDFIWLEAAFYIDEEIKSKIKEQEVGVIADLRVLLKDIDDIQRIKASGKSNLIVKWEDLPSQQKNKKPVDDIKVRKEFLKNLSEQYKNKYIKIENKEHLNDL